MTRAPAVAMPGVAAARTGAGALRLRAALPEHAAGIAALLAQPLPGAIRLALPPVPPPGDARQHAVVAVDGAGAVVGCGLRMVQALRLGGVARRVGYLAGLRRAAAVPAAGRLLAAGLRRLVATRADDEADHDLTSILAGNAHALRVLGRLPGAPVYHALGGYRTWVLAARALARRGGPPAERVAAADVAAVQALADAHAVDYQRAVAVAAAPQDWLVARRAGRPVAALRLERRPPPVVAGYVPWLGALRPLVNAACALSARPTLPAPGAALGALHIAALSVAADDAQALAGLLGAAGRAALAAGLAQVVVGLGAAHPAFALVDRLPAWRLDSRLFAVGAPPPAGVRASPETAWL